MENFCMCGTQSGYPHGPLCPFPYYGNNDKWIAEWGAQQAELSKKLTTQHTIGICKNVGKIADARKLVFGKAAPPLALHRANCDNCGHPHGDHAFPSRDCGRFRCYCPGYVEDTPEAATCRCGHMAANHAQNIAKCKIGGCGCDNFDKAVTNGTRQGNPRQPRTPTDQRTTPEPPPTPSPFRQYRCVTTVAKTEEPKEQTK